jgi:hypothetical protein
LTSNSKLLIEKDLLGGEDETHETEMEKRIEHAAPAQELH